MARNNLPMEVVDLKLTQKEIVFLGEYCTNGFDHVESFKKAKLHRDGDSDTFLRIKSQELLNRDNIRIAIDRFIENSVDPYRAKFQHLSLEVWIMRANYDNAWFYKPDGSVKPLDEIPREYRVCIDQIMEDYKGKDADRQVVNYKLADRAQAKKIVDDILKVKDTSKTEDNSKNNEIRSLVEGIFNVGAKLGMGMKQAEKPDNTILIDGNKLAKSKAQTPVIEEVPVGKKTSSKQKLQ